MSNSNDNTRAPLAYRKYQIKNARGQAAYKTRMREAGYKQIAIWVHEGAREAGRLAGLESDTPLPDAAQNEPLGWMVGFAEGLRLREKKGG
jgi:hypothetical protein